MKNNHHPDCKASHINWSACTAIIALLCALFALLGWLWSDRSKVDEKFSNIVTQSASINERVGTLEKNSDALKVQLDILIPTVARIEQSVIDINKRLDSAQRIKVITRGPVHNGSTSYATADPKPNK
jgi:hypothetical protein